MKEKNFFLGLFSILILGLVSTSNSKLIYQKNGVEVYIEDESSEFDNAKLSEFHHTILDSQKAQFNFSIENYTLKADSRNNLTGLCANSKDGQHIHLIVDNKPYTALYQNEHRTKLDSGSHLALAFLSRSHHQSIKHKHAFILKPIHIGKKSKNFNLKTPYLFYSRPKGIYVGNDTKEILLDFYLVNVQLSKSGYRVKVELDSTHQFILYQWKPYLIKGLSIGDHKIKLTLLDSKNKIVKTPFPITERVFTLQDNP